jgi:hypothetical protein
MRRIIPARWAWILIALLLVPVWGSAQAQGGGVIGYGSSVFGSITADSLQVTYSFAGEESDLVTIDVIGLTGGLDPALLVTGPEGEPVAAGDNDRFATGSSDVRLSVFLAQTGSYALVVSGADGTTGDFMLRLRGRPPMPGTPLEFGAPLTFEVPPNAPPQYFTFEAGTCPTELVVSTGGEGSPSAFPSVVKMRSAQGREILLLRGEAAREARLTVLPLSGRYEVEVLAEDVGLSGSLTLTVACAGEVPAAVPTPGKTGEQAAPPPAPTPVPTPTPPEPVEEQPPRDCSGFGLTGPLTGMANGPQAFTWGPAPGATGYRLNLYADSGDLALSQDVAAPATTVTVDASTDAVGGGFLFTVELLALYGDVPGCVSQLQTLRQPGAD